ncbi:hypothetical protein [Cyanobium sp. Copco_Reservoir_LC18]|uniref:hypothetical protein n=1 Tax=Cyanobium sp. Copco_Reservoir_LC18 TaxID=1328305 RepID=UPI00135687CA|nr:hypothetical protein [Cyanobium sp. Copco_Reservoir_LC18]
MKNLIIQTPNEDGTLINSIPLIQSVLKSKQALEVNLEEPDGYGLRIVDLDTTPGMGVKLIGETSIGCKKGLCSLKRGNPLIPSVLRIQRIRFSHQALMSFRKDKAIAGWVARNLFMHLRRKGPIDIWARDQRDGAHANPHNAIQFTSRYCWFLKDCFDEQAWNSRSREALIELSSVIGLNLFTDRFAMRASQELSRTLLPPNQHLQQELELKVEISRHLATSVIWKGV